jgi:hypothetical protein
MMLMRTAYATILPTFVLAGSLFGQQQSGWIPALNDVNILYRYQALSGMKACDLEFRDQAQGTGNTTFDIVINYSSADLTSDGKTKAKSDTEHLVTTPVRSANSRIPNCSAVSDARVSFVQRH